jgi:hypothetical protein
MTAMRLDDVDTGSSAAMTLASRWRDDCKKHHQLCQTQHRVSPYSPTRLVEIRDSNLLRLSTSRPTVEPYVALSHRWGLIGLPTTTLDNLEQRARLIPWEDLSPLMRDAVKVVRSLGYRFFWVDALCIIQDSKDDWLHEASQMRNVYSSASLTLAAADCEDHTQGMFRPRQAKCIRPFPLDRVRQFTGLEFHRLKANTSTKETPYVFPATKIHLRGNRPKGPLDTRGWILQEQLLSPRILYYGKGELFWDCITHSVSESSPVSTSLLENDNPDETWAFRILRRAIAGSGDTSLLQAHLADIWTQVVQNYSARGLSHSRDKLLALQGILQAVERLLGVKPVAAMWPRDIWKQLIWWNVNHASMRHVATGYGSFPAPTWSWLCINGQASYRKAVAPREHIKSAQEHRFVDLESCVIIESVVAETLPDATGVRGILDISGPTFSYQIDESDVKNSEWKTIQRAGQFKMKLGHARWMLDRIVTLPVQVECLIVAQDEMAKDFVCLCLVPDTSSPTQRRRIGLCQWDGFAWQVAKVLGEKLNKKKFSIV